ncbi:MAG TPA: hypothetical protein VFV58_01595 [Blastocatellia bacterium]|nr:hypothetical protein [Blastocatellia bacterium]
MNSKLLLVLFLSLLIAPGLSQSTQKTPFKIHITNKPQKVSIGQKYKFTFEIQNTSSDDLSLCLLPGFSSYTWHWRNSDGSFGATSIGRAGDKMIIATSYDPKTEEFHCRYFHYDRDDFITIPPRGNVKLEVDIEAPAKCNAHIAKLTVDFESQWDGSELNMKAWTGKAAPLHISLPINER